MVNFQNSLVLLCSAIFLGSLVVLKTVDCAAHEDGAFGYEASNYLAQSPFFLTGEEESEAPSEIGRQLDGASSDDDDADDVVGDEEINDEPNNIDGMFLNSNALSSMYQAKPLLPSGGNAGSVDNKNKHRSYCHPPNPCPKGHSPATHGCDSGVKDTAEWNRLDQEHNMRLGKCACDVEHMFSCPPGVPTVSVATAKQASQQQQQQGSSNKQVRSSSPLMEDDNDNQVLYEKYEEAVAAKKSPAMPVLLVRKKKDAAANSNAKANDAMMMMDFTVDDEKVVAKKSPPFV